MVGAETGLEKPRVTTFVHKTLREGHYEAEFQVPASFGPVGAVLVENEHHKEIFIREIKLVTGGDTSTAVTFDCNSWVHSKFDNPEKRIFFTLKVSTDRFSSGQKSINGDRRQGMTIVYVVSRCLMHAVVLAIGHAQGARGSEEEGPAGAARRRARRAQAIRARLRLRCLQRPG